ncbi:P-loop NTPase [Halobacteriales archaeon Cl-PHB]
MTVTDSELKTRLATVEDPLNDDDVVSLGLINDVTVHDGTASISLAFNAPFAPAEIEMGNAIRDAVADLDLEADLTASVDAQQGFDEEVLPQVKNVVAVASGKGGVGKTTVATNLAAGLSDMGARVGLLDADVHGPNAPNILETEETPSMTPSGGILPPKAGDVKLMSTEYLLPDDEDEPAVLRGPMVTNVMMKFVNEVEWGKLDYLVVDLPPGTGDASLNLLQTLPVVGTVIVTTPQEMAVADARKGLKLFEKHDTPILGVVENMSHYVCPSCDDDHDVFGSGGAEEICDSYDVPHLADLPVHPDFDSDRSDGPAVSDEDNAMRDLLLDLAEDVADRIGELNRRQVAEAMADDEVPEEAAVER